MNLVAALVWPEYPCRFLAESLIMEEAKARGCIFNGTIGVAKCVSSDPSNRQNPPETTESPNEKPPREENELLAPSCTPGIATTAKTAHEGLYARVFVGTVGKQLVSNNPRSQSETPFSNV